MCLGFVRDVSHGNWLAISQLANWMEIPKFRKPFLSDTFSWDLTQLKPRLFAISVTVKGSFEG